MNNLIKTILCLVVVAFTFTNCSQEEETSKSQKKFESVSFWVNVSGSPKSSTRGVTADKNGVPSFSEGSQIIMAIDGSSNQVCMLEYDGKNWNVRKLSDNVTFSNSGKIHAVFSDLLTWDGENVTTFGDILYTKEGSYSMDGDVIRIELNMNIRPLAALRIYGIPEGFWIDGIQEFTKVNLSNMTFEETHSNGKQNSFHFNWNTEGEDSPSKSGTLFYGMIANKNGSTTIKLVNGKGSFYQKTFYSKTLEVNDFIEIDGPLVANGWESYISLANIVANEDINLSEGETDDITKYYTLNPPNATNIMLEYSSSDNGVVTVDSQGKITAISRGHAKITVRSKTDGLSCVISVKIKDITDLIVAQNNGGSIININGLIRYGSQLSWKFLNNSQQTVKLISMQLVDGKTGKAGNIMEVNVEIPAKSSVVYTTTIGLLGINSPVTCRFVYELAGQSYTTEAIYEN